MHHMFMQKLGNIKLGRQFIFLRT